ncbi:ABC transporter substrate-binding protein [Lentisphaerota bacterium ZTH]|nr:ABC transporter substrate-binding protein [Lentisphaerota bacterium]WET07623.1 ABC transporter substrate-binding protein [Lentisphaerota bacterium ZTH]
MLRIFIAASLLSALIFPAAGNPAENKCLKSVTLTLHWLPQAQFAGYYMALKKGFYQQQGLDVKILHKKPHESIFELLKKRKTDFITVFLSTAIKARSQGLDLVNTGQISQKSALVFVARKDSNIKTIKDMHGCKVGIWTVDFKVIPQVLLQKNNVKSEIIPVVSDVDLFLWRGVDVIVTMWYNEYHMILNAGINEDELTTFFFSDHGLDIPEDGIYCLERYWQKNPEICRRLLAATMQGWRAAFRNKKKALRLIQKYCKAGHRPFNKAHQQWMLSKMEKLIFPDNQNCQGRLSASAFKKSVKILQMAGVIKAVPTYNSFCRIADLSKIERGNDVQRSKSGF